MELLQPLFHRAHGAECVCSDFGCELSPPLCDCLHYNAERQNCINQPSYSLPASRAKCDGAALLLFLRSPRRQLCEIMAFAFTLARKSGSYDTPKMHFLRLSSRFVCVCAEGAKRGAQARFEVTSNWIDAATPLFLTQRLNWNWDFASLGAILSKKYP